MVSAALRSLLAGSLFGVGLTYAAVYFPLTIIDQLLVKNLHMLRVFLTGTASSTIVIATFTHLNLLEASPRPPYTVGLFSPYDANIIGGLLIGVGMALTGACPGTVLPQVSIGFASAPLALAGAVIGGFLWVVVGANIRKPVPLASGEQWTLDGKTGLNKGQTTTGLVALCMTMVLLSTTIDGGRSYLAQGVQGGLAIGAAQAGSILLTSNSIGSSAAYEDAGKWILWLLRGRNSAKPPLQALSFAGGALLGSWVYARGSSIDIQDNKAISPISSVVGGICLAFGARLAGGCTSGHGISGMATQSVASFVTVAAMFGSGMLAIRFL